MIPPQVVSGLTAASCVLLACFVSMPAAAQPDFGDDASEFAGDGECDDSRFEGEGAATTLLDDDLSHDATDCRTRFGQGQIAVREGATADGTRVERGWLERGDDTLTSGEFADTYRFEGESGHRALVDVRSSDFDPYLLVRTPGGEQIDNDDYEGDASRSLLALSLTENGVYEVTVTSYSKGETGGYTVAIALEGHEPAAQRIDRAGALEAADETLITGEYIDAYDFQGWPGQHVAIDLTSDEFDTYLILKDPSGGQVENDDAEGDDRVGHSSIASDLTQTGMYRVLVTSYEPGETGPYRLTIDPSAGAPAQESSLRDVTTITVSRPSNGVKGPPSGFVRTQGPQSGYRHLVIDRGSTGPFDVLFER